MCGQEHDWKDGFAWHEKLLMRGGLAVAVGTGCLAIARSNQLVAAGYLLFVAIGGLVVVYDSLCVYCPYPFKYSDCLFLPYPLIASVTKMRVKPIPRFRNALSALVFLGIVAIPQYWLWGQWALLGLFWGLVAAGGITIPAHFCRRCRHRRCPMNLAAQKVDGPR